MPAPVEQRPNERFAGCRSLVIGGTSGIGLATVRALRAEGAEVTAASRSPQSHPDQGELPAGVQTAAVDLTDPDSIDALFASIDALDHLVVTAAEVPSGRVAETDLAILRPAVESRLFGSLRAATLASERMSDGGSIVFFSGLAGHRGFPGEAMASAACGAIEALTRALAVELAPVRVNTLVPGNVWSPIFQNFFGEDAAAVADQLAERLPAGRLADPAEIAHAVMFALENSYVTGSSLFIDGGFAVI